MSKYIRSSCVNILVFFCLISAVNARNGTKFDRATCREEITKLQEQANFTKNTAYYFLKDPVSLLLSNGPDNMTVTLAGCYEFCGPWTFYWDALPRLVTWIVPILLLLSNIELSPIDKQRFMTIVHALGDPIDTFWSLIHKIYIWNRLYAIGLEKSPRGLGDAVPRVFYFRIYGAVTSGVRRIAEILKLKKPLPSPLDRGMTSGERATIIATVLAGFEEIAGAKIKSEDYYHMITRQLGNLGEQNEDQVIFEQWRRTALILADARTNEFPRTCLAVFVYIFGLVTALLPSLGGGSTSPPGGRIASAIFLSWLVPLVLVSNTIGTFTSRRTCLTIMSHFVSTSKSFAESQATGAVPPPPSDRGRGDSSLSSTEVEGNAENGQEEDVQMGPIRSNDDAIPFIDEAFDVKPFDVETPNLPGHHAPLADEDSKKGLISKGQWITYFESLQWLGSIYSYRPWKVLYPDIDRRTYDHYNRGLMALGGFFPIALSTGAAFVIMWAAVPTGFSCRHVWVLGIPIVWCVSALWTSWTYIHYKEKGGHTHWKHTLIKDAIVSVACTSIILFSTGGLFNNCWCWSAYMMRGKAGYVPLSTDAGYLQYRERVYSIVIGFCIGAQILYFLGLMYWWWGGVTLVRWTEAQRWREWEQENPGNVAYTDDYYLLFWYRPSQLKKVQSRRT